MFKVSPTRMELLRLKRRLALARRGHRLLKDKEEQLLTNFYRLVEESRGSREGLENRFRKAAAGYLSVRAGRSEGEMLRFLTPPAYQSRVSLKSSRLLNIEIPNLRAEWTPRPEKFSSRPLDLFDSLGAYRQLAPDILKLAELETTMIRFAVEIERTRRRVNSLEFILIPELERTTRAIELRLEESERENFVRLKHIKRLSESRPAAESPR
ncbi:MAG TPA: V-type ATP synthase subunit D [bacterium]|nr:V-type ATP synthase subunit D [bacterium]HNS48078.1 V-type ATP synthase subunit D [bacterium]